MEGHRGTYTTQAAIKRGNRRCETLLREAEIYETLGGGGDLEALWKALLTCHDEYLLASMVQGIDGALVGFASVIPGLIHDLLQAVKAGDLTRAMEIQARIDPLKDAVYGAGEPTGEAHANMKAAMVAAGIFKNGTMRPPTIAPNRAELKAIEAAVAAAGLKPAAAAE